jgi:hypothetical protein
MTSELSCWGKGNDVKTGRNEHMRSTTRISSVLVLSFIRISIEQLPTLDLPSRKATDKQGGQTESEPESGGDVTRRPNKQLVLLYSDIPITINTRLQINVTPERAPYS